MTDWGAHHFGGATFICNVRELQPEQVVYHEGADGRYLAYHYPNGLILYTTARVPGTCRSKERRAKNCRRNRSPPTRGGNDLG